MINAEEDCQALQDDPNKLHDCAEKGQMELCTDNYKALKMRAIIEYTTCKLNNTEISFAQYEGLRNRPL